MNCAANLSHSGVWDDVLDLAFRIPHDHPPRWLLVFTAYLDETAHDGQERMFVAGFLGNQDSWKKVSEGWGAAIAPMSALHTSKLRFKGDRHRNLVRRASNLVTSSGVTPLIGSVRKTDYADLVSESWMTKEGKIFAAWILCFTAILVEALKFIPEYERLEVVFERQAQYERFAGVVCGVVGEMPEFALPNGRPKLIGCRSVDKDSTQLTQPADLLAFALLQREKAPDGLKANVTGSILIANPPEAMVGALLGRDMARQIIRDTFTEVMNIEGSA